MLFTIALLTCIVILVAIAKAKSGTPASPQPNVKPTVSYRYRRKSFVMTKAENDFFNTLISIVGDKYYVFPQLRLSSVLDHKIHGQNWKGALAFINQKSIDYMICDKQYRRPLLGIELDDWSHDGDERKQRDANVEFVFKQSGIPLLRVRDVRNMSPEDIRADVAQYITLEEGTQTLQGNL